MDKKKVMRQPRDLQGTTLCSLTFAALGLALGAYAAAWAISNLPIFAQNGWRPVAILKSALGLAGVDLFGSARSFKIIYTRFPMPYCYSPQATASVGVLGATLAGWIGWWLTTPQPAVEHLAGRQLEEEETAVEALKKEMKKEIGKGEAGIEIFPGVPISLDRETKHIFAVGGSGAGKTTFIFPITRAAAARGDRLLIYDNKGEWTQRFDGVILAPWDKRCAAWKISEDLQNIADARNFAQALIKDSSDPMWANAARAILTAVLVYLIKERDQWDLQDVLREIAKGYKHLRSIIHKYTPEASGLVESEEITKTSQSFLIVLSSYMSTVSDLAAAWNKKPAISIRKWLLTDKKHKNPKHRIIILQGNERYKQLEQSYIQAIMSVVGATVSSPTMTESRTRRIWFVFDEIIQVGKVPTLTKMLEVGRSKGVRMIIGSQNISQIREVYGEHTAENWTSNIGTYFLGRALAVETAEFLAKLCGKQKTRKYVASYSGGGVGGSTGDSRQDSWQEQDEYIVRPDEFSTLGNRQKQKAVEGLLLTGGQTVYKLLWPWVDAKIVRSEDEPAAWTKRRKTKQVIDFHREMQQEQEEKKRAGGGEGGSPAQNQAQEQSQAAPEAKPAPAPKPKPKPDPEPEREPQQTAPVDPEFLPPGAAEETKENPAEPEEEEADAQEEAAGEVMEIMMPGLEETDMIAKLAALGGGVLSGPSGPKSPAADTVPGIDEDQEEEEF
ncbi:MAG: type IV secretion system DNA-binding domain-containing protein [Desulfuromonadales bacterium]|nr:type IV secretion system DNA-binding domain-containing protein [Desulfuromonadales bacterium]MDW7757286.1 type IV secretion system DNA-binding domain-containing protein [Desulfuromonadales bacterium]